MKVLGESVIAEKRRNVQIDLNKEAQWGHQSHTFLLKSDTHEAQYNNKICVSVPRVLSVRATNS